MKHWGRFLKEAGKPVEYFVERIEMKEEAISRLQRDLLSLQQNVTDLEREFFEFVQKDWSEDEIKEAKKRFEEEKNNHH